MVRLSITLAKKLSKYVSGGAGRFLHIVLTALMYYYSFKFLFWIFGFVMPKEKFINKFCYESNGIVRLKEQYLIPLIAILFAIVIVFFVLFITSIVLSKKYFGQAPTFGSARFSELSEVIKAGLHGDGIIFGKIGQKLISKPPNVEGHVLVVGGTGTGKSRGVVIPSLLRWKGSALVIDIKGELSRITSNRRKMFGPIYIFNPEGEGDCYDPIAQCRTIDDAQDLARILIPVPATGDPFWAQSAQAILAAFVFEGAIEKRTLSEIAEKLCITPIEELIEHCKNSKIREVRLLASITYELPDKTLGGVMGELKSKLLTIATDRNICKATSQSDWSPESLEEGATIYLRVPEHLIEQYKDILTVIISQTLRHLSKREDYKQPPVLIAIDELPRLSRIYGLTQALATLRSRNVHILGIIQSMAQLDKIYGIEERKVIADNCRFKLVLSATDPETQRYFSDLAGQKTVMSKGSTINGFNQSISKTEQGTPLIRPEEFANLKEPILFAPMLYPTKVKLAFWDKEKL